MQTHYQYLKTANPQIEDLDAYYTKEYFKTPAPVKEQFAFSSASIPSSSRMFVRQVKTHILHTEEATIEVGEKLYEWQVGTKIVTQETPGVVKVVARGQQVDYKIYAVITAKCIDQIEQSVQNQCFNALDQLVTRQYGQNGVKALDHNHYELKINDDTRLVASTDSTGRPSSDSNSSTGDDSSGSISPNAEECQIPQNIQVIGDASDCGPISQII